VRDADSALPSFWPTRRPVVSVRCRLVARTSEADPLIRLPAGRATAAALPDAERSSCPAWDTTYHANSGPLVAAISRLAGRVEAGTTKQ
jgi:hypothetical protein